MAESNGIQAELFGEVQQVRKCDRCYKPNQSHHRKCAACRKITNVQQASRRRALTAAGLCTWCAEPSLPGKATCQKHLQVDRDRFAARPKRQNFCPCGNGPLTPKYKLCRTCRRKNENATTNNWRKKVSEAGLCPSCCKPNDLGGAYCAACRARAKELRDDLKKRCFALFGGVCACCEEKEIAFLSLDHINNDGAEKRRAGESTGTALYRKIAGGAPRSHLQVLCANCQWGKKHNGGVCPHQQTRLLAGLDGEGI